MSVTEIATGVARMPVSIANIYFVGEPGGPWSLVDTGTSGNAQKIRAAAEERFGGGARPESIVLTHGHFDHAGSARDLAEMWDVPVYAHPLEEPYLTGRSAYPPRDPTVGGFMALLSRFFPSKTALAGGNLQPLPENGEVPGMPGWKWHHTPGHSPGHISLFLASRSILLAGDAIATLDLDSFFSTALQQPRISRPPSPMTCDWTQARHSVEFLAGLRPYSLGAGHGPPMTGANVAYELSKFARHFPAPSHGRYAWQPAIADESGVRYVPPAPPDPLPRMAAGIGIALAAATLLAMRSRRDSA